MPEEEDIPENITLAEGHPPITQIWSGVAIPSFYMKRFWGDALLWQVPASERLGAAMALRPHSSLISLNLNAMSKPVRILAW